MMTGLFFLAEAKTPSSTPIVICLALVYVWFYFSYVPKKFKRSLEERKRKRIRQQSFRHFNDFDEN